MRSTLARLARAGLMLVAVSLLAAAGLAEPDPDSLEDADEEAAPSTAHDARPATSAPAGDPASPAPVLRGVMSVGGRKVGVVELPDQNATREGESGQRIPETDWVLERVGNRAGTAEIRVPGQGTLSDRGRASRGGTSHTAPAAAPGSGVEVLRGRGRSAPGTPGARDIQDIPGHQVSHEPVETRPVPGPSGPAAGAVTRLDCSSIAEPLEQLAHPGHTTIVMVTSDG